MADERRCLYYLSPAMAERRGKPGVPSMAVRGGRPGAAPRMGVANQIDIGAYWCVAMKDVPSGRGAADGTLA